MIHLDRPLAHPDTTHLRDRMLSQVDKDGALLIRPPTATADSVAFARFCESLRLAPFDVGPTAVTQTLVVAPHVWLSHDATPSSSVPFNHKMSHCLRWPRYVLLMCEVPAAYGGMTRLVDSIALAQACRESCAEGCEELDARGVRYIRTLPYHDDPSSPIRGGWPRALNALTPNDAERSLAARSLRGEWVADGALCISTPVRPVFRACDAGRGEAFFNSAFLARSTQNTARKQPPTHIVFGDGTSLSPAAAAVFDFAAMWADQNCIRPAWQAGDVLILDNHQVMQGRDKFTPPRRVLSSMWMSGVTTGVDRSTRAVVRDEGIHYAAAKQ